MQFTDNGKDQSVIATLHCIVQQVKGFFGELKLHA
jgi:hypothetical protein